MNSQITFLKGLAFAALLTVLSTSAILAENFSNVQGSFAGQGVGVVQGTTLMASDSASGAASQIGTFTVTIIAIGDLASTNFSGFSGGFVMVFPNGDVIHGSMTGGPDPSDAAHFHQILTIAGGTGRFQDATGTLTLDRHSDFSTLPAYELNAGTLQGSISTPAK